MARRFVAVARQEYAAVVGKVLADIDQDTRQDYLLADQDQGSGEESSDDSSGATAS
jgi:hypothetical protein